MDILAFVITFSIAYGIGYVTGKSEKDEQIDFDEESY